MDSDTPEKSLWKDIATLINKLPEAERRRYYQRIAEFSHDLNHSLGIIYNGQELARRSLDKPESDPEEALEWLGMIQENYLLTHKKLGHMTQTLFDSIDLPENGDPLA